MKFIPTHIKGLYIIELTPFIDHRGKFRRVFCEDEFKQINFKKKIIQINLSFTEKKRNN